MIIEILIVYTKDYPKLPDCRGENELLFGRHELYDFNNHEITPESLDKHWLPSHK